LRLSPFRTGILFFSEVGKTFRLTKKPVREKTAAAEIEDIQTAPDSSKMINGRKLGRNAKCKIKNAKLKMQKVFWPVFQSELSRAI
jgi:hypothetical protein